MTVGMIWAQTVGGVIGRDGTIPWHVPEDMAHFREVTASHPVIMGRRTWQSLPEKFRPLPGRRNIVVTRQSDWAADGATVVHSPSEALRAAGAATGETAWIIGGAELYAAALETATVLEITQIDDEADGDTYAPALGHEWSLRSRQPAQGWNTSKAGIRYRFLSYIR